MNKRPTVTIGIPAHNEEANIANMLNSIISQEQESFVLERIIVILDGCADNTEGIVREFAKRYPIVKLIADGKRMGKNARLNQIYEINKSDIVINFDADILLKGNKVLEKMIAAFHDSKVGIVSANSRPMEGINFVQKMANASENMWYEVRKDLNDGDNIYNIPGCATAITRSFAENFSFPKNSCADEIFQYLASIDRDLKFRFVKDAVVLYRSPSNLKELFRQFSRFLNNENNVKPYFSNKISNIEKIFEVPFYFKIKGVSKAFTEDPLYTAAAIAFQILLRVFPSKDALHEKGMWNVVVSTKRKITCSQ